MGSLRACVTVTKATKAMGDKFVISWYMNEMSSFTSPKVGVDGDESPSKINIYIKNDRNVINSQVQVH
jgi:hypothetical protein